MSIDAHFPNRQFRLLLPGNQQAPIPLLFRSYRISEILSVLAEHFGGLHARAVSAQIRKAIPFIY